MHHALLLREIIAEILQSERSTPGFLHTCLFINKNFWFEASRILWNRCGKLYSYATAGYINPMIKDLARIVQENPQRAQFYADFIHVLGFGDEGEANNFDDEAKWHPQLALVQFPNLEDVSLYPSPNAVLLNTGDVLIHYAQPNVKAFTLWEGSRLSEDFLSTLGRCCPRLKSLDLRGISESSVTEDGLVHFLESASALVEISIRTGLDDCWSRKAFEALAQRRNLRSISIPYIQDHWIHTLRDANPIDPVFPKLKEFRGGVTDQCLQNLAQYIPTVNILEVYLQHLPLSHHILASASNFSGLRRLVIQFGVGHTLNGHDLILLTKQCGRLTELSIGEYESHRPSAYGMNDNVIGEVARNLCNISHLSLQFSRPRLLSWQSILFFAQHCKNLEILKVTCNLNWQDVISGPMTGISFPSLWWLTVVLDNEGRDEQIANGQDTIRTVVDRFAILVPKLSTLTTEGGNTADDTLKWAIYDMCMERS